MIQELKFTKVRDVKSPERGTKNSAGIDFFVPNDLKTVVLSKGHNYLIPSGIKVNIPHGFVLKADNKGSVAGKKNLIRGAGVVDEDYTGEIFIDVHNIGYETQWINPGDKIIQFMLMPVEYPEIIEILSELDLFKDKSSDRGEGKLGSTNK